MVRCCADTRKTLHQLVDESWPAMEGPSHAFPGRRSKSKTRARHSRTFSAINPWPNWNAGLAQFRDGLPATAKIFNTEVHFPCASDKLEIYV